MEDKKNEVLISDKVLFESPCQNKRHKIIFVNSCVILKGMLLFPGIKSHSESIILLSGTFNKF